MNNPKQLVQSSISSYVNYFQKQMADIWRPDNKKKRLPNFHVDYENRFSPARSEKRWGSAGKEGMK